MTVPVILLPAYNEAGSIASLLRSLASQLRAVGQGRIVVVDDGSTDDTGQIVQDFTEWPVELIQHRPNKGLHEAMRTGLTHVVRTAAPDDVLVTMDADDTHDPRLIPSMLRLVEQGHDVVIASRFRPGAEVHGLTLPRRLYSIAASWLFRLRFRMRGVRDYTCGYRAYRVRTLGKVMEHWGTEFITATDFSVMADILLRFRVVQPRATEVPLVLRYDKKLSTSKLDARRTIVSSLALLWTR
jgi:dolichol-phosphate mannosyltransferase